jgi:hypothetical protein
MKNIPHYYQCFLIKLKSFDGIPALLLRLYLAPVFIMAGFSKTQLLSEDVTGLSDLGSDHEACHRVTAQTHSDTHKQNQSK